MKLSNYVLVFVSISILSMSCSKDDDGKEPEAPSQYETQSKNFTAFIENKSFQLVSFYADKPIDYIQDDAVVKAETELWPYVKDYIKDDKNFFNSTTGIVEIDQSVVRYPTNDSATLKRNYKVGFTKNFAYIDFVDYNYIPTRYKLLEFKDDYFVIYLDFKDRVTNATATIYSRFQLR